MNPVRLMLKPPPPSEDKAATTIQAYYRGFVVRRSRPLEKLQIIYQVRQDLKDHMQVLGEPSQFEKLCTDPKERLRWSECAMALLLRLDSVQGAHADVRDIRKIVTKEVLAFQEIIDSTSKDASSGKKPDSRDGRRPDEELPFRSLFFALQQQDWIFVSAKHLFRDHRR